MRSPRWSWRSICSHLNDRWVGRAPIRPCPPDGYYPCVDAGRRLNIAMPSIVHTGLPALVARHPGRKHHAPVRLRGRRLDLLRHVAQRERIAGAHRLQPAHAVQAGRTHARFLAAHPVQHHAHHHRAGMPAAGDHAAVDRFGRRFPVDMEGLRVELGGERNDLVFADGALAEVDFLARHEIVEIPLLVAHAAALSLKPGCAMKRARWWSASPSVSSIVERRLK